MAQRISKRDLRDARRARAEELKRQEARRNAQLTMLVIGGAIALGVVLLLLVALSINRRGGGTTPTPSTTPSTTVSTGSATARATSTPTSTPKTTGSPTASK